MLVAAEACSEVLNEDFSLFLLVWQGKWTEHRTYGDWLRQVNPIQGN